MSVHIRKTSLFHKITSWPADVMLEINERVQDMMDSSSSDKLQHILVPGFVLHIAYSLSAWASPRGHTCVLRSILGEHRVCPEEALFGCLQIVLVLFSSANIVWILTRWRTYGILADNDRKQIKETMRIWQPSYQALCLMAFLSPVHIMVWDVHGSNIYVSMTNLFLTFQILVIVYLFNSTLENKKKIYMCTLKEYTRLHTPSVDFQKKQ